MTTMPPTIAELEAELAAAHAELAALHAGLRGAAIAKRLSIERYASRFLDGSDFDALSDRELMIETVLAADDRYTRRFFKGLVDDYVAGVFDTIMRMHRAKSRRRTFPRPQPEHLRLVHDVAASTPQGEP